MALRAINGDEKLDRRAIVSEPQPKEAGSTHLLTTRFSIEQALRTSKHAAAEYIRGSRA
jgi:hypothetical protein